eukprot:1339869-Amphidinium_carterae.1
MAKAITSPFEELAATLWAVHLCNAECVDGGGPTCPEVRGAPTNPKNKEQNEHIKKMSKTSLQH